MRLTQPTSSILPHIKTMHTKATLTSSSAVRSNTVVQQCDAREMSSLQTPTLGGQQWLSVLFGDFNIKDKCLVKKKEKTSTVNYIQNGVACGTSTRTFQSQGIINDQSTM